MSKKDNGVLYILSTKTIKRLKTGEVLRFIFIKMSNTMVS